MSKKCLVSLVCFFIFMLGFCIPERKVIPVKGATPSDWHKDTFWYEPWGSSGVHKGIDIFAAKNTPVLATTNLLVLYRGELAKGGKVVIALGPKWRVHYFAHLANIKYDSGIWHGVGKVLGGVGASGNAQGKSPHLHYSIISLIPLPWRIDGSTQGYKKAFFLNPIEYLKID